MSTIESVSHEHRIFEPPSHFVAQANVKKADFDALNAAAAKDFPGFWAKLARDEVLWKKPFTQVARRVERAVLQVVRGRRAQCFLQLPRPQPRERQRGQGRDHLRGRRRRRDEGDLPGALPSGVPPRERAALAGDRQGRPRAGLHADVDRGRRRHAGLRAHRRDAFGRVRRLFREVAAGAHHRRRGGRGDHGRRAGPRRQAPAAEGDRRRGARHGWVRGNPQRHRVPPHRRQCRVLGAARCLAARNRGETGGHVRTGMGRRRASAVHSLHVRLDGQAERCTAQLGRLPALGDAHDALVVRHQARGRLLVHRRHRLGHRSYLYRVRTARRRRDGSDLRGHSDVSGRRPLLADDREAQGLDLLYGADRDPGAGQGLGCHSVDRADELRSVDACASWAPSASRSIPKRGCGTTQRSAAGAARSSTRGGRRRRAAT